MKTVLAAALAAVTVGGSAPDISSLDPAALKALIPEHIPWKPGQNGNQFAVLVGDQSKPGFYVVMNRFQPGNFDQPHYHANDRYILVVSGTWWVATGMTYDPLHRTVPLKAGTFVHHVARQVHYDGVRPGSGPVELLVFGQGPGDRIECMGPKADSGPGPCADAKAREAK
jgi:hypothetical protein